MTSKKTNSKSMDDLNFDDISGTSRKKSPEKKAKSVSSKKKGNTTRGKVKDEDGNIIAAGIQLAIPTDDIHSWIGKDIMEVNGEEFVRWAAGVYPVVLEAEQFEDSRPRLRMLNKIASFHRVALFQTGEKRKQPIPMC